jgi:hypothetical protein
LPPANETIPACGTVAIIIPGIPISVGLGSCLILVPGAHTISAIGQYAIVGGFALNPTQLTVESFKFNVTVNPGGVSSIPNL